MNIHSTSDSQVSQGAIQGAVWSLYIDGASRNNPGPAGVGIAVLKNKIPYLHKGFYIGIKTNNQAEYTALLLGLFYMEPVMGVTDKLYIFSDSELLVRQLEGKYAVKDLILKQMFMCIRSSLTNKNYVIEHIERSYNSVADRLANEGIDKKNNLPKDFHDFCVRHNIFFNL